MIRELKWFGIEVAAILVIGWIVLIFGGCSKPDAVIGPEPLIWVQAIDRDGQPLYIYDHMILTADEAKGLSEADVKPYGSWIPRPAYLANPGEIRDPVLRDTAQR